MTQDLKVASERPVKVALVQLRGADADIKVTIKHMREMVLRAVKEGVDSHNNVDLVVLGEVWNSLISADFFKQYAEPVPGVNQTESEWDSASLTCRALAAVAREANVWLIGGSIPEREGPLFYNTATVWSPDGTLVQKYRKTHLFDLCLPKMTFKESDTFAAGNSLATFQTPFGKFGLALCYDIRFAEIAMIAARQGCLGIFYPAAFNTVTGPLHWELLQRARALDNQMFVATCSVSRDPASSYVVYGHSMAVSPMGQVIATAETEETIVHTTFDPQVVKDTRLGIPLTLQRRFDLYPDLATLV